LHKTRGAVCAQVAGIAFIAVADKGFPVNYTIPVRTGIGVARVYDDRHASAVAIRLVALGASVAKQAIVTGVAFTLNAGFPGHNTFPIHTGVRITGIHNDRLAAAVAVGLVALGAGVAKPTGKAHFAFAANAGLTGHNAGPVHTGVVNTRVALLRDRIVTRRKDHHHTRHQTHQLLRHDVLLSPNGEPRLRGENCYLFLNCD